VYRGSALPQFRGRYLFGDWSESFGAPSGKLFVAKPRKRGLWDVQQLRIATSPTGELGHRVLVRGVDGYRGHPRVAVALDGRPRACEVEVGDDHALEERAPAGDGGDGGADATGAEDEDAHGGDPRP
jgi:hypothetical protein